MSKTREIMRKGLACLFALALAVAFVPGLGAQPAHADTHTIANPSTNTNNPTEVSDGTYQCSATGGTYYFAYEAPSEGDCIVTIEASGISGASSYYCNGSSAANTLNNGTNTVAADGEWLIELDVRASGDFTLVFSSVEYSWGTLAVSGLDNVTPGKSNIPFTVSLNGAASDVSLQGWSLAGWHQSGDLSGHSGTGALSTANIPAGSWDLLIDLTSDTFLTTAKRLTYSIPVRPAAVTNVKASSFNVGYKSAKITGAAAVGIGDATKNGSKIRIQQYRSGSWTTVKTIDSGTASATLSGLKANTTYKYRLVGCVPATGSGKELTGAASETITVKTGLKTAPKVKSVKVTGAKVKKTAKTWHSGRWDAGGVWHAGYYTSGSYQTTYTVKVKLKKKVSGTKGILINGTKAKGTGKTFTKKFTVSGKLKGKKRSFAIASYRAPSYIGSSKSVTKKAKIK